MALSVGFRVPVSQLQPCYPSYGAPTLTPVGLSPTERASLRWSHNISITCSSGTPWTWRENWASSEIITTRIASTARSMARRPHDAPAHPHLLLPRLIVTLGGNIAAAYFKPRLPLDWEFATHTMSGKSCQPGVALDRVIKAVSGSTKASSTDS